MLIPSLALVVGMHLLALRFTRSGWLAVLVAIATPAFLVSATSLMSDVPMLALWVWTAVVFLAALDSNKTLHFALAGVLMTGRILTKYFGLAVVPLLGAYALMRDRSSGLGPSALASRLPESLHSVSIPILSTASIPSWTRLNTRATQTTLHPTVFYSEEQSVSSSWAAAISARSSLLLGCGLGAVTWWGSAEW